MKALKLFDACGEEQEEGEEKAWNNKLTCPLSTKPPWLAREEEEEEEEEE